MSAEEIDRYLAQLDQPTRVTLRQLRESIARVVPDAEEGLSYGVLAFRVGGRPVAGFSAARNHLSYLPHSGTVLGRFDLRRWRVTTPPRVRSGSRSGHHRPTGWCVV